MTYETQMVELFRTLWWFACLWVLCYWLFRRYRRDVFRYKLFVIRDALFDAAADGLIPFDHPAYGMMRQYLNGLIRFAHRLNTTTLLFFILLSLFTKTHENMPRFSVKLLAACQTLPTETARTKILSVYACVHYYVFAYVTFTSPIFLPLFLVALTISTVRNLTRYGAIRFRKATEEFARTAPGIELVDKEAELYGGLI
jgi:hypothetical protein